MTGNRISWQREYYSHIQKHMTPISRKGQRVFLTIYVLVFRSLAFAHYRATVEPNSVMEAWNQKPYYRWREVILLAGDTAGS